MVNKTCVDISDILLRFLWSVVLRPDKNHSWYHPALVELLHKILYQGTWRTFFKGG